MFGTYRLLLAIMVVFQHLGGIEDVGGYAVFGFYALSGYLMTLILHQNYGYSAKGRSKYAVNRFLRIYPLYWTVALVSFVIVVIVGESFAQEYFRGLFLPSNGRAILQNLFIIFGRNSVPRLSPPAWALTVELFFYACIGLGLSKTKTRTWAWFIASVLYTIIVNALALPWQFKYFVIPAAS